MLKLCNIPVIFGLNCACEITVPFCFSVFENILSFYTSMEDGRNYEDENKISVTGCMFPKHSAVLQDGQYVDPFKVGCTTVKVRL
jgi:hypothetical protein